MHSFLTDNDYAIESIACNYVCNFVQYNFVYETCHTPDYLVVLVTFRSRYGNALLVFGRYFSLYKMLISQITQKNMLFNSMRRAGWLRIKKNLNKFLFFH